MTQAGPGVHYSNTMIHISQLAVTSDVIKDATFTNCLVTGPAVLLPMADTHLRGCQWDGSPDGLFWPIETGRQSVIGAIALQGCTFEGCRFQRIGLAYLENDAARVLGGFRAARTQC